MRLVLISGWAGAFFLWAVPCQAGTLTSAPVSPQATAESTPPWEVTVQGPGWLAGVTGDLGTHGHTTHVDLGFGDYVNKINALGAMAVELRRGRIGIDEGFLYLNAQGSQGGSGLVNKVDVGVQSYLNQFAIAYRVLESRKGWLDLLAGFRFTYLGSQTGLQSNQENVSTASTNLVNQFAEQVTTPGTNINALVQQIIGTQLESLDGRNPVLPVPPVFAPEKGPLLDAIRQILAANQGKLAAAIESGVQARVNQLKANLTTEVENRLNSKLNSSISLYTDWFDPFIGIRGRCNFYKSFYFTGETDIGGFGIGTEVTCQVYGALGYQLTPNMFTEVGYRFLYDDYNTTQLIYQAALHGVQISAGIKF